MIRYSIAQIYCRALKSWSTTLRKTVASQSLHIGDTKFPLAGLNATTPIEDSISYFISDCRVDFWLIFLRFLGWIFENQTNQHSVGGPPPPFPRVRFFGTESYLRSWAFVLTVADTFANLDTPNTRHDPRNIIEYTELNRLNGRSCIYSCLADLVSHFSPPLFLLVSLSFPESSLFTSTWSFSYGF